MYSSYNYENENGIHEEEEYNSSTDFLNKPGKGKREDLNKTIFLQLEQIARKHIEMGNLDQGFENYDRCIEHLLLMVPEGIESEVFQDFMSRTINFLNDFALRLLQLDKWKDSLRILERCQVLSNPEKYGVDPSLRNLTFNHLGCCYRRMGKLDKALFYLERAEQVLMHMGRVEGGGITHINLCAVLSQMGE
jgi:Tetratricopeptide repeat.